MIWLIGDIDIGLSSCKPNDIRYLPNARWLQERLSCHVSRPRSSDVSEILNGSGLAGAGSQLASTLRGAGFQVVDVRNADRFDYPKTLVVLRTTDLGAARKVARQLGRAQIIRQRAIVDWDVTVVIGRDRSQRS